MTSHLQTQDVIQTCIFMTRNSARSLHKAASFDEQAQELQRQAEFRQDTARSVRSGRSSLTPRHLANSSYLRAHILFVATYAQATTTKLRHYFAALLFNKEMIGSCSRESQGKNSGKAAVLLTAFPRIIFSVSFD